MNNKETFNKIQYIIGKAFKKALNNPNNSMYINTRYNDQYIRRKINKFKSFIELFDKEVKKSHNEGNVDFDVILKNVKNKERDKVRDQEMITISEQVLKIISGDISKENQEVINNAQERISPYLENEFFESDAKWVIGALKKITGNDLEDEVKKIEKEIELYGLNAMYSDSYEVRARESSQYERRDEIMKSVRNYIVSNVVEKEKILVEDRSLYEYETIPTVHKTDDLAVARIEKFLVVSKKILELAESKEEMRFSTFETYENILNGLYSYDEENMLSKLDYAKERSINDINRYIKKDVELGLKTVEVVHSMVSDLILDKKSENEFSM